MAELPFYPLGLRLWKSGSPRENRVLLPKRGGKLYDRSQESLGEAPEVDRQLVPPQPSDICSHPCKSWGLLQPCLMVTPRWGHQDCWATSRAGQHSAQVGCLRRPLPLLSPGCWAQWLALRAGTEKAVINVGLLCCTPGANIRF